MKTISMVRVVAVAFAVVMPGAVVAQEISSEAVLVPASAPAVTVFRAPAAPAAIVMSGPRFVQAGVQRAEVVVTATEPMLRQQGPASRRDVAWMVIGGATLVVGSLVGGDAGTIIMVTGGVVGLMGLWRYLQ